MIKSGQTANGVAHFAPMMELKAPQWNMRNPFNDLIAIALKEREMELKEKEMGLKEKGLGLDEQKFAYGAANDEINRQHAIELANLKTNGDRENLNLKYNWIERIGDKDNKLKNGAYDYIWQLLKEYNEKVKTHSESGNTNPYTPFIDYVLANPGFKAGIVQYGGENMSKALTDIGQQGIINKAVGTSNIGPDGTYNSKSKNLQNDDDSNDW
ncbi:hypothetical protein V2I21_08480 [Campylobacter sp. CLAX-22107-21]|uniref:hypothetical protein n=1 Tax=Campylobacter devanensis TaxID=3161138 RepID=UPI002EC3B698|nr:hypothetical protein [Campylobacter sp. CLAX-22107-21]